MHAYNPVPRVQCACCCTTLPSFGVRRPRGRRTAELFSLLDVWDPVSCRNAFSSWPLLLFTLQRWIKPGPHLTKRPDLISGSLCDHRPRRRTNSPPTSRSGVLISTVVDNPKLEPGSRVLIQIARHRDLTTHLVLDRDARDDSSRQS